MRVAIVFYSFPRDTGYANLMLARYLAGLGVDVHYVASDLPIYHQDRTARSVYQNFGAGRTMKPGDAERYDGYIVHCVGHRYVGGVPMLIGLQRKLREIRPDIVQSYVMAGWLPLQLAWARLTLGFHLFSAAHTTASVFPLAKRKASWLDRQWLANLLLRAIPGRLVSTVTRHCYAATDDCADVARRFYGVPAHKLSVVPLGVDITNFFPLRTAEDQQQRERLRADLGFGGEDVVCIYTGQMTDAKNPRVLADAVVQLRATGVPVRGLFIGDGPQAPAIAARDGCIVCPFMPHRELAAYYRSAEIGVWPTQESMSMLDTAACGLPIIVNDTLLARERIDGNGLTYRLNDPADLAQQIRTLLEPAARRTLGAIGARRMVELFSWERIACLRLADYEAALAPRR